MNGQAQRCLLRRTVHISRLARRTAPPNLRHKRIAKARNISAREQERVQVPAQGKCHPVVDRAKLPTISRGTHSIRRTDCAPGGQAGRMLEFAIMSGTSNGLTRRILRAMFTVVPFRLMKRAQLRKRMRKPKGLVCAFLLISGPRVCTVPLPRR